MKRLAPSGLGAPCSTPAEKTQLILAEAQLLREAGRSDEAYALLETSLAKQPDNPELLYETALTAERQGKPQVLEKHLKHLLKLKPDHAHALNALGYSLAERNTRLAEAHKLISQALALAPQDPFIMDSLGWVEFRLGNKADARKHLEAAFKTRPDVEIAAHLGEVLWSMGDKDGATRVWKEGQRASPDNDTLKETLKRLGASL